jgi:hypothetical protein
MWSEGAGTLSAVYGSISYDPSGSSWCPAATFIVAFKLDGVDQMNVTTDVAGVIQGTGSTGFELLNSVAAGSAPVVVTPGSHSLDVTVEPQSFPAGCDGTTFSVTIYPVAFS